jgi:hypothetical protein
MAASRAHLEVIAGTIRALIIAAGNRHLAFEDKKASIELNGNVASAPATATLSQWDQALAQMSEVLLDREAPHNPPCGGHDDEISWSARIDRRTESRSSSIAVGSPSMTSRALIPLDHARSSGAQPA